MGFFSGLISLFNYLFVLIFVFIIGVLIGLVAFKLMLEKYCPKAHMLMTTELFYREEKKVSQAEQTEALKDGVIWTE